MTESQENPSIYLSYQHIKDVLESQARVRDGLDSKLSTLWAIGTAIIGVGLPMLLSRSMGAPIPYLLMVYAAVAFYIVATALAIFAYFPRRIRFMGDPTVTREQFWELSKEQFPLELSLHIEDAFESNKSVQKVKAYSVMGIFVAVLCETGLMVSWALLFSLD